MSILSKIKRGGDVLPPRIILSGPEGIGKSTFAANAPAPLFIAQEDGLAGLEHIARLTPKDFGEVLALIDELTSGPCEYQNIVIDTADWLERSIHQFICARDSKTDIEAYGYGKGYKIAEAELVKLLTKLDALRHAKKVGIIILSHVHIRTFTDPAGEAWDRYEMKGHKGFTGILREWPEACLFAVYEVFKQKERGEQREKTIGGDRIIHTQWSPGWDAKNRLSLPDVLTMPADDPFGPFAEAVEANRPDNLRAQYSELLKTAALEGEARKKWEAVNVSAMPPERLKAGIAKLETLQPKSK